MLLLYYLWGLGAGAAAAAPPDQWYPSYPDRPQRALPRHRWPAMMVEPIDPIPRPAPPTDLTWYVPITAWQRQPLWRPAGASVLPPPLVCPGVIVRWYPSYPTQVLPRSTHALRPSEVHPLSVQQAIASVVHWQGIYPAQLHTRARRPLGGATLVFAQPTVPTIPSTCIEWTDETLTAPQLTAEAALSPNLAVETLASPSLAEEDLC